MLKTLLLPATLVAAMLSSACNQPQPIPPAEIAAIDSLMGRAGPHVERDSLGVPMVVAPAGTAYEYTHGDTVFEIGPLESLPLSAPAVLPEDHPRLPVDSVGALIRTPAADRSGAPSTTSSPTPPSRGRKRP
jgi:hypothetical protein